MRDHFVKRVFLNAETDQIRAMQARAPEFTRHYPKHTQWLDKAILEILEGRRVAFGVQAAGMTEEGLPRSELVGSIIIKESDYSGVVELKNLFMKEKARRKHWGASLYKAAELYCSKAGHRAIQTEVPCDELGTVGFLLSMGFRVIDMAPSPYRSGENIYHMHKLVPPLFVGDVFDFRSQAEWVLRNTYSFGLEERCDGRTIINFIHPRMDDSHHSDEAKINGIAGIAAESKNCSEADVARLFDGSGAHIRILFAETLEEDARAFCIQQGIKAFEGGALRTLLGQQLAQPSPLFRKAEIGGMIISLKSELYDRTPDDGSIFAYCKGGPTGKYLMSGNLAAFTVEQSSGRDELTAIGKIEVVDIGNPEEVWRKIRSRNPLFTEEEYWRFASSKQSIIGLTISSLTQVSPAILFSEFKERLVEGAVNNDDIGHIYLSNEVAQEIRNKAEEGKVTIPTNRYDVALSFAGEDRKYAEELAARLNEASIEVFYDSFEQANLWGKDLYQHLQVIYRHQAKFCVVFLSENYARKLWTNHELKQMQARAFEERQEYILPVKIDDTEIPGINPTVGYVDLRNVSVSHIAELIVQKLTE